MTGLRQRQLKLENAHLQHKAKVTQRGAVLLGNSVACDAYDEKKPLRVVTHAHADHTGGLRWSLRECKKVLMTEATKDLIEVLEGPLGAKANAIEVLEYGKPLQYEGENITLIKANHILGAAQVLVESEEGYRLAYTGDFRLEETPILEDCDVLVVDATYGSPHCKRSFNVDVRELIVNMVEDRLKKGVVYVFGYYGKLQEVMQILNKADVAVPFVMPDKVYHVSKTCEKHGMKLGCLTHSTAKEAKSMLDENLPCVAFYHMNSRGNFGLNAERICVSGWEFHSPVRQISENEHLVALSDHSDFNGILEYVRRAKPKMVITDNHRVSHGETLAREITKRLGIPAVAMPHKSCQ
ncbi:MAG TPA: MBL fold metallo-hydrolase [Candidatus Bathyarchaeia archaeon]|nr:MBL fold metallo-hydrolase [Candidatus Bathyarchaeia archaeon]